MLAQPDGSPRLSDAEKLIRAHDGAMALLYIYIGYAGGFDRESAAAALCMTLAEVDSAMEKLARIGLAGGGVLKEEAACTEAAGAAAARQPAAAGPAVIGCGSGGAGAAAGAAAGSAAGYAAGYVSAGAGPAYAYTTSGRAAGCASAEAGTAGAYTTSGRAAGCASAGAEPGCADASAGCAQDSASASGRRPAAQKPAAAGRQAEQRQAGSSPAGSGGRAALYPPADPPQYTMEDVRAICERDSEFSAVVQEAKSVFGHDLCSNDLQRLCSTYNYLGLPAEVMFVLLHHCAEAASAASRRLTMGFIEKKAYAWANDRIDTFELAEAYCERYREMNTALGRIKKALDISDRNLTPTEEKIISSWVDMGFDESAICEAYDRAVTRTGKRSLPYISGILTNWHSAGLHTIEEIRRSEAPSSKGAASAPKGGEGPFSVTEVEDILTQITGGRASD